MTAEALADPAVDGAAADVDAGWARDNQRHLVLAAAAVAARFEVRPAAADEAGIAADALAADLRRRSGRVTGLERVASLFDLTGFERDLLVAVAAPELGLPAAGEPVTFASAMAALPGAHWSAVLPDAPLRGWRLLDLPVPWPAGGFGGVSQTPLSVDERVLHALLGADTVDDRLAGRARTVDGATALPARHRAVVAEVVAHTTAARAEPVVVVGEDRGTRRQVAVTAARTSGRSALAVEAADLPDDPVAIDQLARLLAREAGLGARLVLVEAEPATVARAGRAVEALARLGAPVVLAADEPAAAGAHPVVTLPPTTAAERRGLFAAALAGEGIAASPDLAADLATHHPLTPAGVAAAVERAARTARDGRPPDVAAACRAVAGRSGGGLARIGRPQGRLADLVLAEPTDRALAALLAHVRQRRRVHGEWGFDERDRGLAVTALFTGPSGTGKTSAAEAVAAEVGLDVVAVDLSQVMSKYIGETEKHLAQLFDVAEAGGVLLFDEGDALFGKRTQVRDSRDRYANLEVSFLLQRLERFGGIAIVTTNVRENLDPAFTRRMRFVVPFAFPDAAQREAIWARAFPAAVPTDGLDPHRLAQLAVSGGTITSLALHAAFLAAEDGTPVGMRHVLAAARTESEKLERPLTAAETRGWT